MRTISTGGTVLGLGVTASLVASLLVATPAASAGTPTEKRRPKTQVTAPVAVGGTTADQRKLPPVSAPGMDRRAWPQARESVVELASGDRSLKRAGETGVLVAAPASAPAALAGSARSKSLAKRGAPASVAVRTTVDKSGSTAVPVVGLTADAPGAVRVTVDYAGYAKSYGGDWASRLRLLDRSGCAAGASTTSCAGTAIPTVNDPEASTLTALVALDRTSSATGAATASLAAAAGPSGTGGDFSATNLAASGSWSGGNSSGDLSWSYPMRVPPAASELAPELSIGYSAASVDGRQTSSNNQPSWIGEGFELSPGYIERRYANCADDMGSGANNTVKTGDLCWKTDAGKTNNEKWDNATISFGGRNGDLVRVGNTTQWRLRDDDGTRVEKLANGLNDDAAKEYWKVTTGDGTQYFFGYGKASSAATEATNSAWTVPVFGNHSGEPDYVAGSFATSQKNRAWRWNLDHVVTTDGDSLTYYYAAEGNRYQRNLNTATAYTAGGYLKRIDYGQRNGAEHTTPASAQVVFTVNERCFNDTALASCDTATMTSANAYHWPDVPFDQICTATCSSTTQVSPTFFSRKRLTKIATQVRNVANTGYDAVESWAFTHSFPDPGDGTTAALWLKTIQHTGQAGTAVPLSPVTFYGQVMDNRVDGVDNAPPLRKWRVYAIDSEAGGRLSWTYSAPDCTPTSLPTPETNTRRCFPAYYTPPGNSTPEKHWFHKYLVTGVLETDRSGASTEAVVTSYTYGGSPAWRYDDSVLTPAKYRTWGQWRGYGKVTTTVGRAGTIQTQSEDTFYRGMNGDRATPTGGTKSVSVTDSLGGSVTDHWRAAGMLREHRVLNGPGGAEVEGAIYDAWIPTATSADDGTLTSLLTGTTSTRLRATLAAGGQRKTQTNTVYDAYGYTTRVEELGDLAVNGDEECSRVTYNRNTSAWLMSTISQSTTTDGDCAVTPTTANTISDSRNYYDLSTSLTTPPTKGNSTRTDELVDTTSGRAWRTTSTSEVDIHGRITKAYDAKNRATTTAYTPATGGPVRSVSVTTPDPDGAGVLTAHTAVTAVDARWGLPTRVTDASGKFSDAAYDGLGRLVSVWAPGRDKATQTPTTRFTYTLRPTGPNAVTTETLTPSGGYVASVSLTDGLLRPRQRQDAVDGGGRTVSDTMYDSRGVADVERGPFFNNQSAPATTIVTAADSSVPSLTQSIRDGAGRVTASVFKKYGVEQWRTTTTYGGDRVTVDPPAGGTPTTTIGNALGQVVERLDYLGASPTGPTRSTTYHYDAAGNLDKVTDPLLNDWTYTYDLQGRQIRSSDPDKGVTDSTYDEVGNLVQTKDALGRVLKYSYDALDRKKAILEADGVTPRATWEWDRFPNGTLAKGLPISATRYVGSAQFVTTVSGYDAANRPTGVDTIIPAVANLVEAPLAKTYTARFAYKVDGSLATAVMGAAGPLPAEVMTYFYNGIGQSDAMTGSGSYVGDTVYSPYGEPLQYAMGNTTGKAVWQTFTYEEGTRRLATSQLDREIVPTPDVVTSRTYDQAGNITKSAAVPSSGTTDTQCYGYDYQQQLTDAWTPGNGDCTAARSTSALGGPAPYWSTWTFDEVGNRKTETSRAPGVSDQVTSYDYPAADSPQPHFATKATTTVNGATTAVRTFAPDLAGNTSTRTVGATSQSLSWDAEGHLSKVTSGSTVLAEHVYDAEGNRLVRREPGKTTLYVNGTEVTYTAATAVVTATRYYSFNGATVAVRTGANSADVSTLASDPHGTAEQSVANTTGALTTRRLSPYGETRGSPPVWPGQRGFVGGTVDGATGLTHLGAREYDADLGKFISVDPLVDPGDPLQMNAYGYGNNNPVTNSDPTGLMSVQGGGGGGGCCYAAPKPPPAPKPPAPKSKGGGGFGGFLKAASVVVSPGLAAAHFCGCVKTVAKTLARAGIELAGPNSQQAKANLGAGMIRGAADTVVFLGTNRNAYGDYAMSSYSHWADGVETRAGIDTNSGTHQVGVVIGIPVPGPGAAVSTAAKITAKVVAKAAAKSAAQTLIKRESVAAAETLAKQVPAYAGGKTSGTLVRASGTEEALISGWHPPAAAMPKGTPGMNIVTKSHVEAHAASIMRNERLTEATLWINRSPCGSVNGCGNLLPRMVPNGATLTINVVPDGSAGAIAETLTIRGVG
ncbi:RHS repeat-associated core domain-containing protein [Pedococcus dokdonensis]|uniref:RHS repeat-associated core domain-containing protein n=1 Tax=Pedococcus dokdonensis TaxID=443156 RepID=A0A1H0ULH7_9MICO|nr:RHS repeat-associated core domain-containing protein [Pedococcus dokdonensis]SDP67192.1 RHS repeat-associated core domain-containing protein [Pedococcus dokdonensis]